MALKSLLLLVLITITVSFIRCGGPSAKLKNAAKGEWTGNTASLRFYSDEQKVYVKQWGPSFRNEKQAKYSFEANAIKIEDVGTVVLTEDGRLHLTVTIKNPSLTSSLDEYLVRTGDATK